MSFIDELCREYDVEVVYESIKDSDAFVIGKTIYLNPDLYPPRMNWRFCHELAHIILGHTDSECISRQDEIEADQKAAELMLPAHLVRPLVRREDLSALKEMFPHASWEALGRRWAQFRPAVLTIFDDGILILRWAPDGFNYPRNTTEPEHELIRHCFEIKQHIDDQIDSLVMHAYYVDDNRGVIRVLLLTEVDLH